MSQILNRARRLVLSWPGYNRFGFYSFLPLFFGLGASLEFCMIKWTANGVNFYNTYKKRLAVQIVDDKEEAAREAEEILKRLKKEKLS